MAEANPANIQIKNTPTIGRIDRDKIPIMKRRARSARPSGLMIDSRAAPSKQKLLEQTFYIQARRKN
jgi:hypothetical protein